MKFRIALASLMGAFLAIAIGLQAPAFAGWTSTKTINAGPMTAATLQAPVNLTSTAATSLLVCVVQITWNHAQPDLKIDGWEITRYAGSVAGAPIRVAPESPVYTDRISLSLLTTYTYRVKAYRGLWTSPEAMTTPLLSVLCL